LTGLVKPGAAAPSRVEQQALSEKAFAAERKLAVIRLIVVAANSVLYWWVLDKQGTIPRLAYAVIAVAALYGLFVWLAEPYRRYPILLSSYFTSLSDSALIMVWLYATGGIASSFYLLLYLSTVAIAFRYPARQTLFAALVYSGSYFALLLLTGDLSGHWGEATVRIIYVFIAAALGVGISSEVYAQTAAKLQLQEKLHEEERARRQEAEIGARRYRFLAESMPQIVWTAGPDGQLDYVNQVLAQYVGQSMKEALTLEWADFVHPEDSAKANATWAQSVQTGEPYDQEVRIRSKDGTYRWFLARAVAMRDPNGKIIKWFGTSTDVEDMKRAESELQRAIRVRDEFLSIAGHELKTPLASLQLVVQGLHRFISKGVEAGGTSKIIERLSRASGQVRALERLVNDLLDVSRMTAGKLILHPEPVDLTQLVDEVVSQYAETAQKMGCPVEVDAAERVVGQWDRVRMEQVITNLLSNALKYGRGKPVKIEVSHDSGKAILRVQDYGIGIDAANLTRIFDRFERAVSEREFGGLGLGLWIVRRIVEASGGSVTVQSVRNSGSTFVVTLPLGTAPERASPTRGVADPAEAKPD
jgi:PAS domain S-box-containing protein